MTKTQLMSQIQGTGLIANDLHLYLDVNPHDQRALAEFKRVNVEYARLVAEYEKHFGPITLPAAKNLDSYFKWVDMPWPWHRQ